MAFDDPGCIRRAYVEARYGRSYRISGEELAWAFDRVEILAERAACAVADHQASLAASLPAPLLPPLAEPRAAIALSQPARRANMLQRTWRILRRVAPQQGRWNPLIAEAAYAAVYASTYGVEEPVVDLVPAMLAAFLDSDRNFVRSREAAARRQT